MGWSQKYKKSIDCNNPKGFSQKAHCAGRKKRESKMDIKGLYGSYVAWPIEIIEDIEDDLELFFYLD